MKALAVLLVLAGCQLPDRYEVSVNHGFGDLDGYGKNELDVDTYGVELGVSGPLFACRDEQRASRPPPPPDWRPAEAPPVARAEEDDSDLLKLALAALSGASVLAGGHYGNRRLQTYRAKKKAA